MIVPMITGGRTLGVMTLRVRRERPALRRATTSRSRRSSPARAATAIENARLYTERSTVARTLQASLLPEAAAARSPGWRFAADYRPGQRGAEVGGDFYDVFAVEGGHMVLLGDVTGKGVRGRGADVARAPHGRTAAAFDPRPSAVLAHGQPGAAPAAADRAGDDAVRPAARAAS